MCCVYLTERTEHAKGQRADAWEVRAALQDQVLLGMCGQLRAEWAQLIDDLDWNVLFRD